LVTPDWELVVRRAEEAARAVARRELGVESRESLASRARELTEARVGVLKGREAEPELVERERLVAECIEGALASVDPRLEAVEIVVVSEDDPPPFARVPKGREDT